MSVDDGNNVRETRRNASDAYHRPLGVCFRQIEARTRAVYMRRKADRRV
jgi:hypothetical protein